MEPPSLFDMHFHLDFCEDPAAHAASARAAGIGMLAVSCEPAGYRSVRGLASPSLVPALGLHPWLVARDGLSPRSLDEFCRLAPDAAAFGELGLDFDDRHAPASSREAQLAAFERCCRAADASSRAAGVRKPLSLHSFRAAETVLDVLGRTGCLESCACVLHWYSDSRPALSRAIEAGCWFSLSERAIRTGRWREYSKLVPAERLLLETDLPSDEGARLNVEEHRESLERCAASLSNLLGHDAATLIEDNSRRLLRPGEQQL